MGRMVEGRTLLYAACFVLAVLGAALRARTLATAAHPLSARTPGPAGAAITAGSFDFPKRTVGTRELVDQALIKSLIQLVPEYADRRWIS